MKDDIKALNGDPTKGLKAIKALREDMYREWMDFNVKQKNKPDDLDLQYSANYYWTRYKIATDYAKKLDDENVANDPEL